MRLLRLAPLIQCDGVVCLQCCLNTFSLEVFLPNAAHAWRGYRIPLVVVLVMVVVVMLLFLGEDC